MPRDAEVTTPTDAVLYQYTKDCDALRQDLELLIEDLQFRINERGTIWYAVDFAEIYAYIFPEDKPRGIKLLTDDTDEVSRVVEQRVLDRLFFQLPYKPILLEPYLIEFRSWIERTRRHDFDKLANYLAAALTRLEEARQIVRQADFQHIRVLLEKRDQELSDEELREAVTFFEEHANELLQLSRQGEPKPEERLGKFLSAKPFEDLREYVGRDIEPDQATVERWYTMLYQRRLWERRRSGRRQSDDTAPSYLDAVAVAIIKAANEHLIKDRKKICLVTRSTHMHTVFDEKERQQWERAGGHVLRSSRYLTALFAAENESDETTLERITGMTESLRLFLEAYEDYKKLLADPDTAAAADEISADRSHSRRDDLQNAIATIKGEWRPQLVTRVRRLSHLQTR